VIAHSVSAMVLQTAAAQDLIGADPARAQDLLASVAATGRQALSETGRLLHVLRDDADELGLQPAPGLADLQNLVEQFRADGLQVTLDLAELLPELPAGLDVRPTGSCRTWVLAQPVQLARRGRCRTAPCSRRETRQRPWPQGRSTPPHGGQASPPASQPAANVRPRTHRYLPSTLGALQAPSDGPPARQSLGGSSRISRA